VVDTYNIGDELEGTVTKVVTFGAFVEILDGVEGLVHISELAQHHVENPREIIQPGDNVKVKILEIDSERRRLSLSIKRVEGQELPVRPIQPPTESEAGDLDNVPELGLSEDVFAGEESAPPAADAPSATSEADEVPTTRASASDEADSAEAPEQAPPAQVEEVPPSQEESAAPAAPAEGEQS
jgi:small subunit ribosomal protein S1